MASKRKTRAPVAPAAADPPPSVTPPAMSEEPGPGGRTSRLVGVEEDLAQVLTMFIGKSECAVPVLRVREIASYGSVTPVPMTPIWIHGVMNLRGTVVPVIDLAAKLGMGPAKVTRRTCLIITEMRVDGELLLMAVVVDSVSRVVDLVASELMDPPPFGSEIAVEFIRGILEIDGRLVMLLDIERVLSTGDVAAMEAISAPVAETAAEARMAVGATQRL